MCLETTQKNRRIAKEDIIVYKHLLKQRNGFVTSYMGTSVKIGNTYESVLDKPTVHGIINRGLHSFKSKDDCIIFTKKYEEVLVECIIPKGSKYYKGDFNGFVSIASDKLKYIAVLKDYY